MELKKLLEETKTKAIYLIDNKGKVIDFFCPEESELSEIKDKIAAFGAVVFNVGSNFLNLFFQTELNEVKLKAKNETLLFFKYNEFLLCFVTDKETNIGLINLMVKKQTNTIKT
ncbi:roadblock/LC7 domain-containing protein [Tenacibaculum caenipelagi]|uniref:Putative regulator of Ras-like GTPase activity (Roadblock/LC7/MglB family) n=1 Tax=Tenacibaculum caenipelagi TaxID=1325435 RepID=A0A4R6TG39_9FLAO|nr:hypothetical protein [Tenacibaculum caenipelagi]TDQ25618.1 putative regulator of Ras-like GTPase activity (Roadblock/LC7/MglB family) [Tenacibaculum caenipelagi]